MPLGSRYSTDSQGKVQYGNKVLFSVISLAVKEIAGVSGLVGKGVRVFVADGMVNADVSIIVFSNVSCTEVAFRVQENVKRSVESMTHYKAGVINVNVMGVNFDETEETLL